MGIARRDCRDGNDPWDRRNRRGAYVAYFQQLTLTSCSPFVAGGFANLLIVKWLRVTGYDEEPVIL